MLRNKLKRIVHRHPVYLSASTRPRNARTLQSCSAPRSISTRRLAKLLFGSGGDLTRLESELPQQFFMWRRRSEGVHTDNLTRHSYIMFPTEGGALFYGDARTYVRRQHAVPVFFGL